MGTPGCPDTSILHLPLQATQSTPFDSYTPPLTLHITQLLHSEGRVFCFHSTYNMPLCTGALEEYKLQGRSLGTQKSSPNPFL